MKGRIGALADAIKSTFGSFDELKKQWTAKALSIQGSGWAYLGLDRETKALGLYTTANQDTLPRGIAPVLGIDMWCVTWLRGNARY